MTDTTDSARVEHATDVCALPMARRLAAMLDRDPLALREGQALPRGWHVMLFNAPTRQSQLRADGAAYLGVTLPDIGLPRLMMGGRQIRFERDIPIGAHVRRETRQTPVQMKQGRSGRFALVQVEHSTFVADERAPAVVETTDYVLREASGAPASAPATAVGAGRAASAAAPASATATAAAAAATASPASRTIVPDERLLFRYSSITDNPHRIHYDMPYASGVEGYPALVVNGSIPAMFLLEMFRACTGREPVAFSSRNLAPMYCGRALHLQAQRDDSFWRLTAQDDTGQITFEARAE